MPNRMLMSALQTKARSSGLTDDLESEKSQVRNYLLQTCSLCRNEMLLEMGDIIYGEKWYHSSCWELVEERALRR